MNREEKIAKAMRWATGAGPGDVALLRMASDTFLEQLGELADDLAARRETKRFEAFDERIACGQLHAHADAMPGITIQLMMSDRTSYKMKSVWSAGTRLPHTLAIGVIGRAVSDVIELPPELPAEISEARICDILHAGNAKAGYSTRFDLDQPTLGI